MASIRMLSRALEKALNLDRPEIQDLWLIREAGWMDGGCFCLALALHKWCSELEPVGVFDPESEIFHHAAVAFEDNFGKRWVVDGSGVSEESGFVERYKEAENLDQPMEYRSIELSHLAGPAAVDPVFDVDALAVHLWDCMGDPERWEYLIKQAPQPVLAPSL